MAKTGHVGHLYIFTFYHMVITIRIAKCILLIQTLLACLTMWKSGLFNILKQICINCVINTNLICIALILLALLTGGPVDKIPLWLEPTVFIELPLSLTKTKTKSQYIKVFLKLEHLSNIITEVGTEWNSEMNGGCYTFH